MDSSRWISELPNHPIFKSDEVKTKFLSLDASKNGAHDGHARLTASSPRRSTKMCFRGPDIILAVGKELRIATFGHDIKNSGATGTFKTLHTPNVQFEIHQVSLSPGGKMLAVAGIHQVAVIVLPRPSYHKLVNSRVDCKSIQVGQYYHAVSASSRVTKVDWHPWSEGGSSLLVLTADSMFREYDISRDTEEPQQTLSFATRPIKGQYTDEDPNAREAVSFCIGKGTADWSPLTIYALMRNGDVYAASPFLPIAASVPKTYIPALEFFVAAKREVIERGITSFIPSHHPSTSTSTTGIEQENEELAVMNDQQLKFVKGLARQILRVSEDNDSNKGGKRNSPQTHVTVQPPRNKYPLARQGPFLFQPAPLDLGGMEEEAEATDITYLEVGVEGCDDDADSEKLGALAVAYQDGRVDICLDTEKVEAQWELGTATSRRAALLDLPSFTVYECIDLGLISCLRDSDDLKLSSGSLMSLLEGNHPTFHVDPLYAGRVAVAHAFGVHLIDIRKWMRILFGAMQDEVTARVGGKSKNAGSSEVTHLLDTFSLQQKATSPVIGFCIVDNAVIGYSSVAVTSQYQAMPIELVMPPDHAEVSPAPPIHTPDPPKSPTSFFQASRTSSFPLSKDSIKDKVYISLLEREPFNVPKFNSRRVAASLPPVASRPVTPASGAQQLPISPEALRSLGSRVEALRTDLREATRGVNAVQARISLQHREMQRQLLKLAELQDQITSHSSQDANSRTNHLLIRTENVVERQKALCGRLDNVLQRLMDAHATDSETGLSEFEKAWFGELRRMKREVGSLEGTGSGDEADSRSLWARTELLKHHLHLLKPEIEELNKKELERRRPRRSGLGSAQHRSVQRRLTQGTKILEAAKSQAEQLTKWLDSNRAEPIY